MKAPPSCLMALLTRRRKRASPASLMVLGDAGHQGWMLLSPWSVMVVVRSLRAAAAKESQVGEDSGGGAAASSSWWPVTVATMVRSRMAMVAVVAVAKEAMAVVEMMVVMGVVMVVVVVVMLVMLVVMLGWVLVTHVRGRAKSQSK